MFTHLLLISKTWNSAYRNLQVLKNTDFIAFAFSLPQMKKKKNVSTSRQFYIQNT